MNRLNRTNLNNLRHSCAHLLAAAVMELWPDTKRTIGPAIDDGFYFDFEFKAPITEADLPMIEKKMREMLPSWKSFERHELSAEVAKKEYPNNPYKHELIDEFSENGKKKISFYKSGNYWDLCRGGHDEHPDKELKHFKLLSLAGAYWRGDEKNKMLTRIYGTVFPTKEELEKYLWQMEEAKKRDHRKLGKQLGLFVFSDLVGPGLPLYTPKGTLVRKLLQDHANELQKEIGYQEVWTPQLTKADLFKTSGHYEKYKDDMFTVHSHYTDEEYFLKPMNCPNHCVLYGSQPRSYRDLPVRFSDFAPLYRDEKPGELGGLTRLRSFSQDDGHCFCRQDQIEEEFTKVIRVVEQALKPFSLDYWIRLSLWDPTNKEKYLGDPATWEKAQTTLTQILKHTKISYKEAQGEAAIYGPKMDFIAVDSLGREWQISTIQLDLIMTKRFGLTYTDEKGVEQTPVMIHRAILGSPERFMGLLLEHTGGHLPVWLSPIQVMVIPITERHVEYAKQIVEQLQNVRIQIDDRNIRMQAKIRDATLQKIPYLAIIGDKEMREQTIALRTREGKDLGGIAIPTFINQLREHLEKKI
ncbi:threonine--tRNA ligase [Candidatus Roizmanbacteria bacterium]|nr:threonine--tRNA ligase [Candidatus Roizmanbacteria bacterium]